MKSSVKQKLLSPWIWCPAVILILGALGSIWFFHNFEKEEYEVYEGMSPQAMRNPLLAAQMYLSKLGFEAESLHGMEIFLQLPPTRDALFIRNMPAGLSKVHNDKLYRWVEEGGHLLLTPSFSTSDHPDIGNILEKIGVDFIEKEEKDCGCPPKEDTSVSSEDEQSDETDITGTDNPAPSETDDAQVAYGDSDENDSESESDENEYLSYDRLININVNEHDVKISYEGYLLLEDQNNEATLRIDGTYRKKYTEEIGTDEGVEYSEEGAWLLQYRVGKGQITVFSDISPFLNHSIDKYDHAYFLTWLLQGNDKIWLHYTIEGDSLFALIWDNFPSLLISLVLLLLFSLWYMQARIGPRLPLDSENSRNILAHIEATGVYNWKNDYSEKILTANREKLLRQWTDVKKGGRLSGSFEETLTLISEESNIDPGIIHMAFRHPVHNEQDLIRISRAMSSIYKHLQVGEHLTNEGN